MRAAHSVRSLIVCRQPWCLVPHAAALARRHSTLAFCGAKFGSLTPEFAEKILHDASDACVMACASGHVRSWNVGAEEMFGFTPEEAIGQHLSQLIVPERHRARHDDGYRAAMTGEPMKYSRRDLLRVPAMCKDGSKISIEFSLQVIRDTAGKPVGSVALMRDVSAMSHTIRSLRTRIGELEKALAAAVPGR